MNRTARLLSIGFGGQLLLSSTAAKLMDRWLPPEVLLLDLGEHRLKDLARPEHVYQLCAPGLTAVFPPLRSLAAFRMNLPRALTSFVGRERELAEIGAVLTEHRLVTLVGSGGVGKTRCSLQVAAEAVETFDDGVWFIELAPLSNGDYIASTIAADVGLRTLAGRRSEWPTWRRFGAKRMLLMFDNCEHLVAAAGPRRGRPAAWLSAGEDFRFEPAVARVSTGRHAGSQRTRGGSLRRRRAFRRTRARGPTVPAKLGGARLSIERAFAVIELGFLPGRFRSGS